MKKTTKIILIAELVVVIGIITFILNIKPIAVAPVSGHVISEGDFSFQFENARKVIISKDKEFKDFIEFSKDFAIKLPPGTYYWKAKNFIQESEVMNFTILGRVSLKLDEINGTLVVYNLGNLDVKIKVLDGENMFANNTITPQHYIKQNLMGNLTDAQIIIEGEEK